MNKYLIQRIKQTLYEFRTPGKYNKLKKDLPYCAEFTDRTNKKLVILNRYYQPLGIDSGTIDSSWYADWDEYPGATISVDHVQLAALNMIPDNRQRPGYKNGDVVYYFYDDSTSPCKGKRELRTYINRVAKAFMLEPMTTDDFIALIQGSLLPGKTISPAELAEINKHRRYLDELFFMEWNLKRRNEATRLPDFFLN